MFDHNKVFWRTNSVVVAFIRKIIYPVQRVEELCLTFYILLCQMEQKSGVEHIHTSDDEESEIDLSSGSGSDDDDSFSAYAEGGIMGLQPYQFEPVLEIVAASESDDSGDDSTEDEEDENRLANLDW